MSKNNSSVFSNVVWKLAERFSAQIVSTVVSIILARLLCPEDYGIVSIVTIIITLCNVFVSSGLGNALIQKKDADELDNCSVFYSSLVISFFLYFLLYLVSPLIGKLYSDVRLVAVIRVMGIRLPMGAINSFQQAYLSRRMQFKRSFLSTIFGTVISAAIGIYMAYRGFGHWALVAQYLSNSFISTIVLSFVIKWVPKLMYSFSRTLNLLSFGWKLLCSSLLDTSFNELRAVLISLKYSSVDLAYYTKGNMYPNLITTNVNTSISNVIFSAMSKCQDDIGQIRSLMKKSVQVSTFFIAPLLLGLFAVADDFVRILLTDKWIECVPFIRITCVYGLFYPIHTINFQALNAIGDSGKVLKLEIIKKVFNVCVILITMWYGVYAIAYGALVVSVLSTFINAFYSKSLFGYSVFSQLLDVLPTFVCAVIMVVAVYLFGAIAPLSGLVLFLLKILVGAITYALFTFLFRLNAFKFVLSKIKR